MKKEFIPYEQALELKELGFNEPCFIYWVFDGVEITFSTSHNKSGWSMIGFKNNQMTKKAGLCSAPLYQQAFRWFREKYNLNGILNHYPNTKLWDFSVHNLLWNGKEFVENVRKEDRSLRYSTYEEAELACLKKLIEIVKTK
jgi:hypothetical protein